MDTNKLIGYLGLSIKSGKCIFGYDKLFESKKKPNLILICSTLNNKVTGKIINFANVKKIDYIKLNKYVICELISRNCKVLSILDENLANAIRNELKMEN